MGAAMAKPHPLTHTVVISNGCGFTEPHPLPCPHVFNNAHPGFWRKYAEFGPS